MSSNISPLGLVGLYSSLAIDTANRPHVSYYNQTDGQLRYAVRSSDGQWTVQTVDSDGSVGLYTSLKLDNAGHPHISYYDNTHGDLKYVFHDGVTWHVQAVDTVGDVGRFSSLALDTQNAPHISYFDATNADLKYAHWNGSSWSIETVDAAGSVGRYTSMALDTGGHPHIAYQDAQAKTLKYTRWTGSAWNTQVVTTSTRPEQGYYTSLALTADGYPHIMHFDFTTGALLYNYWNGSLWVRGVGPDIFGSYPSLTLDISGRPRVAYYLDNKPKYAEWNGSSWNIQEIDGPLGGQYPSLAFDASGEPHAVYMSPYRYPIGSLQYKRRQNGTWGYPETVDRAPGDWFTIPPVPGDPLFDNAYTYGLAEAKINTIAIGRFTSPTTAEGTWTFWYCPNSGDLILPPATGTWTSLWHQATVTQGITSMMSSELRDVLDRVDLGLGDSQK